MCCHSLVCCVWQTNYPTVIGGMTQGETSSYNPNTGVLVLNNYRGSSLYAVTANDEMVDECTIRIEGECVINQNVSSQTPAISMGRVKHLKMIFAEGALLEVNSQSVLLDNTSTCIYAPNSNIDISCEGTTGTLSLLSAPNGKLYGMGINARYGTVTLKNNVSVNIKVETLIQNTDGNNPSCGINADSLCVDDNAKLNIDITEVKGTAHAFYTDDYIYQRNYTNSQKVYLGKISEVSFKKMGNGYYTKEGELNNKYEYCGVEENSYSSDTGVYTLRYKGYTNIVSSVNIVVPEPVYGEHIPRGVRTDLGKISDEVGYYNNNVHYLVFEDDSWKECSGVFGYKRYQLRASVYPLPQDQLSVFTMYKDSLKVTVNGKVCDSFEFDSSNPRQGLVIKHELGMPKVDTLDIKIAGQFVTSLNCTDLTAISGVTGTASYDPGTKTLYLEDASITEMTLAGGLAVENEMDSLKINVVGDCSISSTAGTGIKNTSKTLIITGTGTLNVTAGNNGIVMTNTNPNNLVIDSIVTVNVTASNYGVQGREYEQRQLGGTTRIYYRTTLKVGGEGSKLSVNGTAKCFQTLGGFIPTDGYEVTAPSRTAYYGTSDEVDYYTFCRLSLSFGKELSDPTTTLTPVAGTAVVIEKPYILGDVNGDGSITMADANMVVNYFLATDPSSIANFNVNAADVNGDKAITMADANQIVNMFLGQ